MSRIGRKHIDVPAGVTVSFENGVVTVKGKLGELKREIKCADIKVKSEPGVVNVERANDDKQTRAYHGLYRQLIADMVAGVEKPFTKTVIVSGVGYKCAVTGNKLVMNIGYSKPVEYAIPQGITIRGPVRGGRRSDQSQASRRAVPRLRIALQHREGPSQGSEDR